MTNLSGFQTPQIDAWADYHRQIERLIETDDINMFLQWYPIQRAVFVGNAKHIRHKLDWIYKTINGDRARALLVENWIGTPSPLPTAKYTSGTRVNMLYHLIQFFKKTGFALQDVDEVYEFGGGYGCMAEMMIRDGFRGRYVIYDLPVMNQIQDFYLSRALYQNAVFTTSRLSDLAPRGGMSAFVATMSFSEIPLESRVEIDTRFEKFDVLFFAFAGEFHGINNTKYFQELRNNFIVGGVHFDWYTWEIDGDLPAVRPDKYYLAAVKK